MQQISAQQLDQWLKDGVAGSRDNPQLLDVREPWEVDVCHLPGAKLMPMQSVPSRFQELDQNLETVVICHHGVRSYQVAMFLEQRGFSRILNLSGGIAAWARQVDPSMPVY